MEPRSVIERALVSAAFCGADSVERISTRITAADIADSMLRIVWLALVELTESGQGLDPVMVLETIGTTHSVNQSVGLDLLVSLSQAPWEAAHIDHYCDALLRYAVTDNANVLGERLMHEAVVDQKVIDSYITKLDSIARDRKDEIKTAKDAVRGLEERKANPAIVHKTGIKLLDDRLKNGGVADGQLAVIGGRPGAGKSVLITQIAATSAWRQEGALIVSLEMLKEEIADRLSKCIPPEQLEMLPLYFIDSTSDLGTICSLIRVACRRHRIGVIAVDYLQLCEVAAGKGENRERQIATVSRRLKRLAMDLQKPIIVGSQLNRESTKRGKPTLADLRESGSIEQDADIVILLSKSDDGPDTLLDIAKQRGGASSEFTMRLDGPNFRFVEAEQGYEWAEKI